MIAKAFGEVKVNMVPLNRIKRALCQRHEDSGSEDCSAGLALICVKGGVTLLNGSEPHFLPG